MVQSTHNPKKIKGAAHKIGDVHDTRKRELREIVQGFLSSANPFSFHNALM